MHNNYYFIKQLSTALGPSLEGKAVLDCYSQNKDELIFIFGDGLEEFTLVATLTDKFSSLYIPEEHNRARKNSITLFQEIFDKKVVKLHQVPYERAFYLIFEGDFRLLFKLFGNRANIILFQDDNVLKLFKNNLRKDREVKLTKLSRNLDLNKETFAATGGDLFKFLPVAGSLIHDYLESFGYAGLSLNQKWELISRLLKELENPEYFIIKYDSKVHLSLVKFGEVLYSFKDPIEALNRFYHFHFRYNQLGELKSRLIKKLESRIEATRSYIRNNEGKLKELQEEAPVSQIADVIMANLHQIKPGEQKLELFNFYTEKNVVINLKKDMSPQQYAEILYRKAKNKPLEIQRIKELIGKKTDLLENLTKDIEEARSSESYKVLSSIAEKYPQKSNEDIGDSVKTYRKEDFMGYEIYIGRTAKENDELTLKFARKDDLWLHAKDVQGSHVIIKKKSGQNFPRPVIERAAELAAYYSKRKNDTLCPVSYTEKKYVRKVKGAPAGAVKVEREKVIMVRPVGSKQ